MVFSYLKPQSCPSLGSCVAEQQAKEGPWSSWEQGTCQHPRSAPIIKSINALAPPLDFPMKEARKDKRAPLQPMEGTFPLHCEEQENQPQASHW